MSRVIFLGPPGAGKGTQAQKLADDLQIRKISTGDMLRAEVSAETPLGLQAKSYMDAGDLVPDQVLIEMVRGQLLSASDGWILDGFPRTLAQAEALDHLLPELDQSYDHVIDLHVPDDILVDRLLNRGRADDKESVIRHRLEVYRNQTKPVIDFYAAKQCFSQIDGNRPVDEVYDNLMSLVNSNSNHHES